jgi:hypothetical protein
MFAVFIGDLLLGETRSHFACLSTAHAWIQNVIHPGRILSKALLVCAGSSFQQS